VTTGCVSLSVPRIHGARVHLRGGPEQGDRTRCGKPRPLYGGRFRVVDTETDGLTCRMCRRCIDADAGLRLTR
jgi:hypothetical protein